MRKILNIPTRCVYKVYAPEIACGTNYEYRKQYTTYCN